MSQTRRCGACHEPIAQKRNLEVTLCLYETDGPEVQDHLEQAYDDYCDGCVLSGAAIHDLLRSMKYKARASR